MAKATEPLVTVGLETSLGAHYVFPDVEPAVIELLNLYRGVSPYVTLLLVNASGARLSVPGRIITRVSFDDKEVWCRDSNA